MSSQWRALKTDAVCKVCTCLCGFNCAEAVLGAAHPQLAAPALEGSAVKSSCHRSPPQAVLSPPPMFYHRSGGRGTACNRGGPAALLCPGQQAPPRPSRGNSSQRRGRGAAWTAVKPSSLAVSQGVHFPCPAWRSQGPSLEHSRPTGLHGSPGCARGGGGCAGGGVDIASPPPERHPVSLPPGLPLPSRTLFCGLTCQCQDSVRTHLEQECNLLHAIRGMF